MTLQSDLFMDADDLVVDAACVSDTLVSLTYRVYGSDGDAGLVQLYARQLEERLRDVAALFRSGDPNGREALARLCN